MYTTIDRIAAKMNAIIDANIGWQRALDFVRPPELNVNLNFSSTRYKGSRQLTYIYVELA
jgi:hypothetical protein